MATRVALRELIVRLTYRRELSEVESCGLDRSGALRVAEFDAL
jgi:hypothetical protein